MSVVVPALNEERHIGRLLGDVRCQTRRPREVIVVDAGSRDTTVAVAQGFTGVRILHGEPPVASGRNLGGRSASGDVVIFLDADTRLPEEFLERFVEDFLRRELEVACPLYAPHDSSPAVERFHRVFNLVTKTFQGILPSGAGICLAVRGDLFRRSQGFDPGLKFDDIELIRRLSRGRRFGIVEEKVFVSDRRYRERGVTRAILEYSRLPASSGPETVEGCKRMPRRGPPSIHGSRPREPKRPRVLPAPIEPKASASSSYLSPRSEKVRTLDHPVYSLARRDNTEKNRCDDGRGS